MEIELLNGVVFSNTSCNVTFMHAIGNRIRNEVVTTLVRSLRPVSHVLASDLRVGNDPLRLTNVLVRSQPKNSFKQA